MAPSQDQILEQFRKELVEEDLLHEGDTIGTDDGTLLRFLRARKFNLKQAKKMWADCVHWRKTVEGVGIDELYKQIDPWDYPERDVVFESWPLYFHKTDKQGRPVNIHYLGGINMPKLYSNGVSAERFWRTIVVNAESLPREVLPAATQAAGRRIDQVFVIVDLKGFGVSQFWQMKGFARDSFQVSQDYFPETMGQLAIVNAPSSFAFIWNIMKPWMAPETVAKIDILGSNYKDVLLKLIDAESLPTRLGGMCTCEGLGGCELSCAGPWNENRVWEGKRTEEQNKKESEPGQPQPALPDQGKDDSEPPTAAPSEDVPGDRKEGQWSTSSVVVDDSSDTRKILGSQHLPVARQEVSVN